MKFQTVTSHRLRILRTVQYLYAVTFTGTKQWMKRPCPKVFSLQVFSFSPCILLHHPVHPELERYFQQQLSTVCTTSGDRRQYDKLWNGHQVTLTSVLSAAFTAYVL
ncbi:hypothetical protein BaRGS_00019211 [Batillaria attramentaria]|uniref:Uncharacterized protein n=1 Tax=Batillaria attramentaria TaxID=370345 RepID=A0ABD0KQV4_9CAEN